MKKIYSLLLTSIFCSTALAMETNIKTATYNVLHGGSAGWLGAKEGNWLKRKQGVCNIIKNIKADIYGLQEVVNDNNQFNDIKEALPKYGYVGLPRSTYTGEKLWQYVTAAAATDEYNPIFYNKETMELIDNGTFGINANASTHLKLLPRICTWAHLKEKATEKDFFTYNTHLDNADENNRIAQVKVVLNDIHQRCNNKPVILMGDLNTTFTGDMQKTLSESGFTHARIVAKEADQGITTHLKKGKPFEIDHMLVKPVKPNNAFNIKTYKVCGERSEDTSDHNPVCMNFSFN
jgi:endonuclease/exonuclease/phosphatase family metal-dependent hydrolase